MTRASFLLMLAQALVVTPVNVALAAPVLPVVTPIVEFPFEASAVYPVVAAPGRITDLVLEPGEALVDTNPIAAGDTARWVIGDTTSGTGEARRVHVLIKPMASGLSTNLIINTTRRGYHLELRASAHGYLAQVRWRYPQPIVLVAAPGVVAPPVALVVKPPVLNLAYKIGGHAPFRPERVYDDGARTYLVLPTGLVDLPPLYRTASDGKAAELINYHVEGRTLVVDGLVARVELRLGLGRFARRVTIVRLGGGTSVGGEGAQ